MLRQAKASSRRCCWGVSSRALAWGRAYARVARVWYVSRSRTMFCWGSFCAGPMFCWGSAFFLPGAMHVYCQPNPKPGRHPPIGSGPSGCQARPPKLASGRLGEPGFASVGRPRCAFFGFFQQLVGRTRASAECAAVTSEMVQDHHSASQLAPGHLRRSAEGPPSISHLLDTP